MIANELQRLFPAAPIYRENQKGGFQEPSFFITKIMTGSKTELFGIQNRRYHYQLVYFPDPERPKADMEVVEELLLDNFTTLGDSATLRNRQTELSEDYTLQMTFEVWVRATPVDNTPKQRKVQTKTKGSVTGR
ncbi:DUF6838 family protein [Agrilactobacillus fermenti]|uniref:phage tail terminator family protein n=1 Tax=Agrilactobacillus fermenti TaxID=2586909 RepID=UPI003A5BD401